MWFVLDFCQILTSCMAYDNECQMSYDRDAYDIYQMIMSNVKYDMEYDMEFGKDTWHGYQMSYMRWLSNSKGTHDMDVKCQMWHGCLTLERINDNEYDMVVKFSSDTWNT